MLFSLTADCLRLQPQLERFQVTSWAFGVTTKSFELLVSRRSDAKTAWVNTNITFPNMKIYEATSAREILNTWVVVVPPCSGNSPCFRFFKFSFPFNFHRCCSLSVCSFCCCLHQEEKKTKNTLKKGAKARNFHLSFSVFHLPVSVKCISFAMSAASFVIELRAAKKWNF